jgi:hypothetical protein
VPEGKGKISSQQRAKSDGSVWQAAYARPATDDHYRQYFVWASNYLGSRMFMAMNFTLFCLSAQTCQQNKFIAPKCRALEVNSASHSRQTKGQGVEVIAST